MPARPTGTSVIRATWDEVRLALAQTDIQSGLCGPRGVGKGQPLSSMVMTIDGPCRMSDIEVDSIVFGSNGLPTVVTGVYPLGKRVIYRVTFEDGSSLRVTDEHLWAVRTNDKTDKVMMTSTLAAKLRQGDALNYRIPLVQSLVFPSRPLELDPYLLGVLLGDGTTRDDQIKFSTEDQEIVASVTKLVPEGDTVRYLNRCNYAIGGGRTKQAIRSLGLDRTYSWQKFVPDKYLYNTQDNRLALLQGLLDTDGSAETRARGGSPVTFSSTSRSLIDAVTFLVQSFGGVVRERGRYTTYTYKGESRTGRQSWELFISAPNDLDLFRLERKRARRKALQTRGLPRRLITSIEPDGMEEAQCISVAAEDGLYVADQCIVTHNTHGAMLCRIKSPNKKLSRITHKVQAHAELSPAEILGMYVPVDNGFTWMDGPVATCYAKGGLLVIDEIVEASGPVKTFLHGALDRGPGGTISYAGRIFEQAAGYQVAATMNGWPDQGGLPPALLDRFDAWFVITQPSEEQLLVLEPDLRDICRDCYDPEVVEDEMEGPDITFRMLLGLQKLRKIMPIEMAVLSACYGNKTVAQSLYEIIQLTDPEEEEIADVVAAPHDPSTMEEEPDEDEDEIAGLDDEADDDDDDWDDE